MSYIFGKKENIPCLNKWIEGQKSCMCWKFFLSYSIWSCFSISKYANLTNVYSMCDSIFFTNIFVLFHCNKKTKTKKKHSTWTEKLFFFAIRAIACAGFEVRIKVLFLFFPAMERSMTAEESVFLEEKHKSFFKGFFCAAFFLFNTTFIRTWKQYKRL